MAQLMQRSMGGPDNGGMLPMVKCSSCGVPVPMDELGEHVCAPAPAPSSYRDRGRGGDDYYDQGYDQRDVTRQPSQGRSRLAPPEPRGPPSQGQSRRSPGGPSGGYNNGYGNTSPNPYDKRPQTPPSPDPRYNNPSPAPVPMSVSGPAGMAGVGRRAFAAAATATRIAVSAQRDRDERQRRQQEQPQGAAGQQSSRYRQRSPPSSPAGPYASPSQSRPNQSPLYGSGSRTPSPPPAPRARDRRADRPPDPPTKQALPNLAMPKPTRQIDLLSNQDGANDSKLPFLEKYKQNAGKNLPSVGTTSMYSESSLDTTPQDTGRSQKLVDALKRQREKEAEEEKEIERERARQLEREREREEEEMEAERKRRAKRKEQERKEKERAEREDREREEEARERERLRDRDRDGDRDRSRQKDNPYGLAATSGRRGHDRSPSDDDSYNNERYDDDDDDGDERIEFPRSPSPERSPRGKNGLKPQHARTKSKSMGVMDRVFDELLDRDPASPTSPSSPGYGEDWDDDAYPKRSITNPTSGQKSSRDQPTTKRRPAAPTEKVCVKCGKTITDGKWIKIDGGSKGKGGVLCEKDWKMMYLPKCRRCDRPIEGQAVGSSDGQIKGKYHRQCFTCDTCEKPFPDTSFYVFDGKPYCAYHYHEANNSLCTASRCGRPIEGPCALAPNGDRYHPEHFTCEYPGGCNQRLDEYWEVEGMKLCDRHAFTGKRAGQKDKAKRRITRFIDLRR